MARKQENRRTSPTCVRSAIDAYLQSFIARQHEDAAREHHEAAREHQEAAAAWWRTSDAVRGIGLDDWLAVMDYIRRTPQVRDTVLAISAKLMGQV
jgi:hypothetical protein